MEEINWDECADEELLEYIVKLGKKLAWDDHIEWYMKNRTKKIKAPDYLPPKEPTYKEMDGTEEFPPVKIYVKRFGSFERAKYLIGFTESFDDPWKNSFEELVDYYVQQTGFSREFAYKMLDGMDKRKKSPIKRKDKQETDSNSYEISLPAYHFA